MNSSSFFSPAMRQIAKDVFFEKGAKNGAIYNLHTSEVYSVNDIACDIIERALGKKALSSTEETYVQKLIEQELFDAEGEFEPFDYEKGLNSIPAFDLVWLEITQSCNMHCIHCYEGCSHISAPVDKRLSLDEWLNVINQIERLGTRRVVVIGGEPTIVPILPEILESLAEKHIRTTLFTNGFFQDKKIFDIICKYKIEVKFSLYGHNATIHDSITKHPGSFQRLISNIKFLVSKNVSVRIAVVLMRENEEYLLDIKSFIESLQIGSYKFDVIREVYSGLQSEHAPLRKDIIDMGRITYPCFSVSEERFRLFFKKNTCWNRKLVVTETGAFLPCVFARNEQFGNIRETSLDVLLGTSSLNYYWNLSFENIEPCRNCEFRYACKDCRPLAQSRQGDIFSKNPRCCYDPYTGKWDSNA